MLSRGSGDFWLVPAHLTEALTMESKLQQLTVDERIKLVGSLGQHRG